jgi:hypothetical protein
MRGANKAVARLYKLLEMMSTTLAVVTLRFQQHGPVCSTPRAVRRHHPFPSVSVF